ncbi:MAG TPA: hypothetical protein VF101_05095 [Gaiellaceae bacterium]
MLAIAIVIALFLTKHLISSAVAGVFLATAAVFVVGLVVFSGPQPLRDAFWSAILALFLYLYALSGPTALSSFGGVAALVAVIWFVITRLPGKQVHAWTVRIASTFTGGATAYAFALLVAGIPFAVAFFRSASMWQPLFRSESAGLWREETRRGVALCDGAPPSPSPRDRVQLG